MSSLHLHVDDASVSVRYTLRSLSRFFQVCVVWVASASVCVCVVWASSAAGAARRITMSVHLTQSRRASRPSGLPLVPGSWPRRPFFLLPRVWTHDTTHLFDATAVGFFLYHQDKVRLCAKKLSQHASLLSLETQEQAARQQVAWAATETSCLCRQATDGQAAGSASRWQDTRIASAVTLGGVSDGTPQRQGPNRHWIRLPRSGPRIWAARLILHRCFGHQKKKKTDVSRQVTKHHSACIRSPSGQHPTHPNPHKRSLSHRGRGACPLVQHTTLLAIALHSWKTHATPRLQDTEHRY